MGVKLLLMGVNSKESIKRFHGFLPDIVGKDELELLIRLYTSAQNSGINQEMLGVLENHGVIVRKDGEVRPTLPLITADYAHQLLPQVQEVASQLGGNSKGLFTSMNNKLEEKWSTVAHVIATQLVLYGVWYRLWQAAAENESAPTAVLIADIDHTPVFYNGILPVRANDTISYWQSPLMEGAQDIDNMIRHSDVLPTLQSMDEDGEVVVHGRAVVVLQPLKMIKSRSQSGLPAKYINLPNIDLELVQKIREELKDFGKLFKAANHQLEKIAKELYEARPQVYAEVNYHDFRQIIFMVFAYAVVQQWINDEGLPEINPVGGSVKKSSGPTISIGLN